MLADTTSEADAVDAGHGDGPYIDMNDCTPSCAVHRGGLCGTPSFSEQLDAQANCCCINSDCWHLPGSSGMCLPYAPSCVSDLGEPCGGTLSDHCVCREGLQCEFPVPDGRGNCQPQPQP
jgi:hypothetical protein